MFGCSTMAGKYNPLPDAGQKDSLSLGFGFYRDSVDIDSSTACAAETERWNRPASAYMVVLTGARVDAISSSTRMFFATLRLSRAAIALTMVSSGTGGLYIKAPSWAT
jgi:hypothetical protein